MESTIKIQVYIPDGKYCSDKNTRCRFKRAIACLLYNEDLVWDTDGKNIQKCEKCQINCLAQ